MTLPTEAGFYWATFKPSFQVKNPFHPEVVQVENCLGSLYVFRAGFQDEYQVDDFKSWSEKLDPKDTGSWAKTEPDVYYWVNCGAYCIYKLSLGKRFFLCTDYTFRIDNKYPVVRFEDLQSVHLYCQSHHLTCESKDD